ncbi:RagB/SusD family nutrient uptake outer membrane protein [Niastella caeni]|uniref:RagB/SusD family nutrient uptake outer membrane protein n=1 Tax=Niastella caeni TaxID=2569763 RepID=A0A4S8HAI3_9BACT|nr:RagB/SusD family nutrient uptake outer membrane protein [Niastella caeni]THU31191.1 RagB/SusD family nutrient uptake outer membrane protein [Niastella caeni]
MKILKYMPLAAVLASSATITSCNKKLEEYNPSGSTSDAVWSTPAGFLTAVNAAYYETRSWYGKEDGTILSEGGTDIWFSSAKAPYAKEIIKYEAFTAAQGTNNNAWKSIWKGINQCNAGINRIDQAGFTDPVEKNTRLAELRFLRAFYYYHIVETWGGVALRTTETDGALLTAKRSTPEEFYDVMIGDLEFAKDNLPNKWGADYSRATKKGALGLLARVYLARGYYSGDANSWFTKASNTAQEVINRKAEFEVDLWASYADMWKPANNKRNKEALFILSNSATNTQSSYDGNASRMHMFYMSQYTSRPGMARDVANGREDDRKFMPTRYLLSLYQDADSRYEGSFKEVWICNKAYTWDGPTALLYGKDSTVFKNTVMRVGDTALVVTKNIVAPAIKASKPYVLLDRYDIYSPANDTILPKFANTYVQLNKFVDPNRTNADQRQGYNDIFPIRLAEMYLIAAEAEFKLGNNGAAATYLNVLRTRAAKPGQTAAMQCSASDITMKYILEERAREMCGEFQRWFDLKRTLKGNNGGTWVSYIKDANPDIMAIQGFHMLRPVPLNELSGLTNRDEFGQNNGY